MPSKPEFMNCSSISFKYRENNIEDKHSPCMTPKLHHAW